MGPEVQKQTNPNTTVSYQKFKKITFEKYHDLVQQLQGVWLFCNALPGLSDLCIALDNSVEQNIKVHKKIWIIPQFFCPPQNLLHFERSCYRSQRSRISGIYVMFVMELLLFLQNYKQISPPNLMWIHWLVFIHWKK